MAIVTVILEGFSGASLDSTTFIDSLSKVLCC